MELRFRTPLLLAVLLAAGLVAAGGASAAATAQNPGPRPQVVDLDGGSPLIQIRILVKAGSAHDPVGREGLAALTADALLEGGFGDAEQPVTKEELARRTRSWGAGANPSVRVSEEVTVFELTVPRDVLDTYVQTVLEPIFGAPLFLEAEVDRLRNEARTYLTGNLRYESLEMLGLQAVDNYVFEGTPYGHTVVGSVQGLSAIEVADVRGFFNAHYRPANMIVGLSTSDEAVQSAIVGALAGSGQAAGTATAPRTPQFEPAPAVVGREAVVVKVPDSGATGVHFAFPLTLDRTHPDFWPLWVANIHLGTHRDSHGVLYDEIRKERGYNYGDYSYVEHFAARPYTLFPPFNTPRRQQYFLTWIRPVASEHAHHLLKAATWELERLIEEGLTEEQVAHSRNKARVLYLNFAESTARLLEARLDDAWYGMDPGYLEGYLQRIDAVTTEDVNRVIRQHLSTENMKILIAAEADRAEEIARSLRAGGIVYGKGPADYQITTVEQEDGTTMYQVPEDRLETLRKDAMWAAYDLDLEPAQVRVVPVEALFESGAFLDPSVLERDAR